VDGFDKRLVQHGLVLLRSAVIQGVDEAQLDEPRRILHLVVQNASAHPANVHAAPHHLAIGCPKEHHNSTVSHHNNNIIH
jgi:hypothetical protein